MQRSAQSKRFLSSRTIHLIFASYEVYALKRFLAYLHLERQSYSSSNFPFSYLQMHLYIFSEHFAFVRYFLSVQHNQFHLIVSIIVLIVATKLVYYCTLCSCKIATVNTHAFCIHNASIAHLFTCSEQFKTINHGHNHLQTRN